MQNGEVVETNDSADGILPSVPDATNVRRRQKGR